MQQAKSSNAVHPPLDPLTGEPIIKKQQFVKAYEVQLKSERLYVTKYVNPAVEFYQYVSQAYQQFQMWIYAY